MVYAVCQHTRASTCEFPCENSSPRWRSTWSARPATGGFDMSLMKYNRLLCAAIVMSVAVAVGHAQPPTETSGGTTLALVPAKAPIVVQLRGWDRSVDRLKAFIKAAVGDFSPQIIGQLESGISQALEGRDLKGLAKDGPIFLVFTEMPTPDKDEPEMAIVARVNNYVQFRDGFLKEDERKELKAEKDGYEVTKVSDKKTFFVNREGFVVVTPSEKSLKVFLDKKTAPIGGLLAKPLAAKLTENDVSVYVDIKAVNKQFGDQIAEAKKNIEQGIILVQGMGNIAKEQIEQAKKAIDMLFQFVEDCDVIVVGADFRSEGALLRLHAQVGEKSKTNATLKAARSAPLPGLAKLPIGQIAYTGSAGGVEGATALLNSMLGLGGGGEGKANKAMEDAMAELAAIKVEETYGSMDYPMTGISVTKYSDPAKAVAASLKLHKAIPENAEFAGMAIKGKVKIEENAQKVNGFTLHGVQMTFDLDKLVERFPEELRETMKAPLKKLIGEETKSWFGTDGTTYVQVTAKDWSEAKKLVDKYLSGQNTLSTEAGFELTRKQLPGPANTLVMIDAARFAYVMAQYISEIIKNAGGIPGGNLGEAKKPEGKSAYIGILLNLEPKHGSLDVFLPADAVKQIIGVLAPMLGGLGGE